MLSTLCFMSVFFPENVHCHRNMTFAFTGRGHAPHLIFMWITAIFTGASGCFLKYSLLLPIRHGGGVQKPTGSCHQVQLHAEWDRRPSEQQHICKCCLVLLYIYIYIYVFPYYNIWNVQTGFCCTNFKYKYVLQLFLKEKETNPMKGFQPSLQRRTSSVFLSVLFCGVH